MYPVVPDKVATYKYVVLTSLSSFSQRINMYEPSVRSSFTCRFFGEEKSLALSFNLATVNMSKDVGCS